MESVEVHQGRTRAAQTKRSLLVLIVCALIGAGLLASQAHAGSVTISWTAPSTNADGSALADLAGYRIYLGTSSPQCPGPGFLAVSSPTRSPQDGQTISQLVSALSGGTTYFARITAVGASGNESACSAAASGMAHADIAVAPSGVTSFGTVAIGASADRSFTVQNTSSASITATVSVGAPFRIVSAVSFSLSPGATQAVSVRFQPTAPGTFAGNVNVSASGDVVSRGVTGTTTGQTNPPPPSSTPPDVPGSPSATEVTPDASGVTASIVWSPGSNATSYTYLAGFSDGTASQQGSVGSAALSLRMPYHASGAAASAWICVQSVNAAGVSADQACGTFTVPAWSAGQPASPPDMPSPPDTPDTPGSPTASVISTKGNSATIAVSWSPASGASSYTWVAGFEDGSAIQEGSASSTSTQFRMPYHASGEAFAMFVCVRAVGPSGESSADQACGGTQVPSRR